MYVTEKISPVFRPVFLKNPGSPESTAFQAYPGISSMPLAGLEPARGEPLDFEFYKPFRSIWNILVLNGTEKPAKTA